MQNTLNQSNPQEKKVILVLGKRGTGKSFLLKKRLSQSVYKRFIVYDVLGEYTDGVIFYDMQSLCQFWSEHYDKDFRIIYRPLEPLEEFDAVCELVWNCGNCMFLVEEVDTFCGSYEMTREFAHIIQRGRHRAITLIAVSQRPYRINRTLSSQAKEMIIFMQTEPRDIQFLSEFLGADVECLRTLKQYHYVHWESPDIINIKKD